MYRSSLIGVLLLALSGCGTSSKDLRHNSETDLPNHSNKIIVHTSEQDQSTNTKRQTASTTSGSDISALSAYQFDSCTFDTSIVDQLGNFDAMLFGKPKSISGVINQAILFDGKHDYLKLPTMDVDYSGGFGFSAWVRFDDEAQEGGNWETIFSFGNDDGAKAYGEKHKSEIWLNRFYKNNKLYFAFSNGDRDELCADVVTESDVIKPHHFQHIAVTIDSANYPHIYIDGKEVKTRVAWHHAGGACELPSVRRDLCYIGKPNDEWMGLDANGGTRDHKDNNLFHGAMDEVVLFNHTPSAKEIATIYERTLKKINFDGTTRETLECHDKPTPKPKPQLKPQPKPTSKPIQHTIVIDGKIDDWADIKGIEMNQDTMKAYADKDYLYLLFSSKTLKNPTAIWFIDSDNNPQTGYQASDWSSSGADYAVGSAGKLYVAKTNDSSWEWDSQSLQSAPEFVNSNGVIELKVSRRDFKLSDHIRVGARIDVGKPDTIPFPVDRMLELSITPSQGEDHTPFAEIRSVLATSGAQYICVGDSTRADDPHFKDGDIVKGIQEAFGSDVEVINGANSGERAQEWAQSVVEEQIAQIRGDGALTVVNIALGINDARVGANEQMIYESIKGGINKILTKHPKTHIMLTIPNPMIGIDSTPYLNAYQKLSKEYPTVDTRDIFRSGDKMLYRSEDPQEFGGAYIHLSAKGEQLVLQRILEAIR